MTKKMSIEEIAGLAMLLQEQCEHIGARSIRIGKDGVDIHVGDARDFGPINVIDRGSDEYPFAFVTEIGTVKINSIHTTTDGDK